MLKRVDKGIYFNTDTKNYELRFTFKNPKTGEKSRPHITAKIKLEDGTIRNAKDKEEAKLAMAQYIANGGPLERIFLNKNRALLSECIKEYLQYCEILNKSRIDLIEKYCKYFLNFLAEYYYKGDYNKACAQIMASEIETIDLVRYMSKRQKDKVTYQTKEGEKWTGRYVSNATINREINSIKGLFSYLKKIQKILDENPCEALGAPLKVIKKVKKPISPQQEAIIFKEAKEDFCFYVMILLLDIVGPRKSEVHNLLWSNVHLESSNVFQYGYLDFLERKNGENLRLPLSKELQDALLNLPRLSEYVFTNPKTGTKYTNRYKKLNTILKKAGVKKLGVGYHIFRHTTAANLEQNGVEASTIKDVLGNTSNVVLNNYLNQGIKRTQEVINLNSERIRKIITKQESKKNVQEVSKNLVSMVGLKIIKR
ncbi:MAG: tyrosine-type recombinase/integrase [Clostridium sp.]|nr:tyrosine-type recombinase/integrase [Clostridium sp.]